MNRRIFLKGLIAAAGIPLAGKLSFAGEKPILFDGCNDYLKTKPFDADGLVMWNKFDDIPKGNETIWHDSSGNGNHLHVKASDFSNIQVKEFLVFDKVHDEETRNKIINYLGSVNISMA